MKKNKRKVNIKNSDELKIVISNKYFLDFLKFITENKKYILYSILVLSLITATFFIARNYIPKQEEKVVEDNNSLNNPDKVTINIDKEQFIPNEIKIKAMRFYDFNFKKTSQTNCSGLMVRDLDIRIDIQQTEKTVPFRINTAGEYKLECYGEENSMRIVVE